MEKDCRQDYNLLIRPKILGDQNMKFVKGGTMLVIGWKEEEIKSVRSETQRLLKLVGHREWYWP